MDRRSFVGGLTACVAAFGLPSPASASSLHRRHHRRPSAGEQHELPSKSGWTLDMIADKNGEHLHLEVGPVGMTDADRKRVRWFFRDHDDHSAEHPIPDRLISGLADMYRRAREPLTLYSGYRTPLTNSRKPGTVNHSRHILGEAADIGLPHAGESRLFALATQTANDNHLALGQYRGQGFVHFDVGPERRWSI